MITKWKKPRRVVLELTPIEAEALRAALSWVEVEEYNGKADALQEKIDAAYKVAEII